MSKKKKITQAVALCLAIAQPLSVFPVFAAEPAGLANTTSGQTKVVLDNKYWYKVKMPAIINLEYDEDTISYKDDYELQACGQINGKMLQIDTDDVEITGNGSRLILENYIGRADKGETNHRYVLGNNEGEHELDEEWQSVKGVAKHDAHGVKAGSYAGTANYKFKLINKPTIQIKGIEENLMIGAGQTHKLEATFEDKDVTKDIKWSTSDSDVAYVNSNGVLITSAKAEAGDTATITAVLPSGFSNKEVASLTDSVKDIFGPMNVQAAMDGNSMSFTVTIVEVDLMDEAETPIESISLFPGESRTVKAVIVPSDESLSFKPVVTWSSTLNRGVRFDENGNECKICLNEDIAEGTKFNIIITIGDYTKTFPIDVKSRHVHTASELVRENIVEATCETEGHYDLVVYCADDKEEISRETVKISAKGHDFGAWQDENGVQVRYCSHDRNHKEIGSLTSYSINYNLDGGSMLDQKTSFTKDDNFALPIPTKNGYTFEGWYTAKNGGVKILNTAEIGTGNITCYARWKINTYVATFNGNGGKDGVSKNLDYGMRLGELPLTTRAGYIFEGWYTAKDGGVKISEDTTIEAGDTMYYAHWKKNTLPTEPIVNPSKTDVSGYTGGDYDITVTVTGSSDTDEIITGDNYTLNVSNATVTKTSVNGNTATFKVTFHKAGMYVAVATVTDSNGGKAVKASQMITVGNGSASGGGQYKNGNFDSGYTNYLEGCYIKSATFNVKFNSGHSDTSGRDSMFIYGRTIDGTEEILDSFSANFQGNQQSRTYTYKGGKKYVQLGVKTTSAHANCAATAKVTYNVNWDYDASIDGKPYTQKSNYNGTQPKYWNQ